MDLKEITESVDLVSSGGLLWSLGDSGVNPPALFEFSAGPLQQIKSLNHCNDLLIPWCVLVMIFFFFFLIQGKKFHE